MIIKRGFLLRGTLAPMAGSMSGMQKPNVIPGRPARPVARIPNRIPSSITVKRNPGMRG